MSDYRVDYFEGAYSDFQSPRLLLESQYNNLKKNVSKGESVTDNDLKGNNLTTHKNK